MENIDMSSILKTLENIEEKKIDKKDISESSLKDIIQNVVNDSTLSKYINIIANEYVSFSTAYKKFSVDGRVPQSKEGELNKLKVKLNDILTQKFGGNINFNEFWNVNCGLLVGEKLDNLECFDINSEKTIIKAQPGKSLIVDIWKDCQEITSYIEIKTQTMEEILSGKVEGINLDKLEFLAISSDENFLSWKQTVTENNLNKLLKQYNNKNILNILGINSIPALVIINSDGIIQYLDHFSMIDFEETLKNLSNDNNTIQIRNSDEPNPNIWWLDMDDHTKIDIVRDINMSMRELGINNATFLVITKYEFKEDKEKSKTLPMFTGTVYETEYEIIQNFAVELQNNWNFNNFQFNTKVIVFGEYGY